MTYFEKVIYKKGKTIDKKKMFIGFELYSFAWAIQYFKDKFSISRG